MASVTVIPATKHKFTALPIGGAAKRRAAGYARVSTDKDEQFTSYEAQVDYYTQYILRNPQFEFVKVYTDEGISGTNTRKRDGFNEMISDALAGKIDIIITKSVSRFARNTVDSLVTIRQLKEKGVEVFFEKENIYTFDSKGELLLTIMSSLAQEESRSISENVTWGRRKQFADGKVCLPYGRFLGYEKGPDGLPRIVPEQAKTVVLIFDLFMAGLTPGAIAKRLTADGIPTPSGGTNWQASTIKSILSNEKYKGDALLQKEFTVDFLQKKKKTNEGEVPQYYVEGSHPAIIAPTLFDRVQREILRRKALGHHYNSKSVLASRIVCGDCGSFYGSKVWNSNSQYRRFIWQCNSKFKGEKCTTPHLEEQDICQRFLTAYNALLGDKEALCEDCRIMQAMLTDTSAIDADLESLRSELEIVVGLTRKCISENTVAAQNQAEYEAKYNALATRYNDIIAQIQTTEQRRDERLNKAKRIETYMEQIKSQSGELTVFDPRLWLEVVDIATVYHDGRIVFRFLDGREIEA